MRAVVVIVCTLLLAGCASTGSTCRAGESAWVDDRLYFGLNTPAGVVTEDQRAAFLRDVVTPRFPDGLTTWRTDGQWRDGATGPIVREPSFVLDIVHVDDDQSNADMGAVVDDYKKRFHQKSVLRVRSPACVAF